MAAEHIYNYWKSDPEYVPNKFQIVGGLEGSISENNNLAFSQYISNIGQTLNNIYGGADTYDVLDKDLYDIEVDGGEQLVIIGGGPARYMPQKSASTVEPALRDLFDFAAPKGRNRHRIGMRMGGEESPERELDDLSPVDEEVIGTEATGEEVIGAETTGEDLQFQDSVNDPDVSQIYDAADEILQACPPDKSFSRNELRGSGKGTKSKMSYDDLDTPSKKDYLNDYAIAKQIDKPHRKSRKSGKAETDTIQDETESTVRDNVLGVTATELIDDALILGANQETFSISQFII